MPYDRFLIAPFNSGLKTNVKPWLIPEDAFSTFKNAYVFRGRVRKRFGGNYTGINPPSTATWQTLSRLRIAVGVIAGGTSSGTVPGSVFKIGQMFSAGPVLYTVYQNGPAAMRATSGSGTYDTTNGNFNIISTGVPPQPDGTIVYFYPATPVMGLDIYSVGPTNNQPSIAFDTQFAYMFSNGWFRSGTAVWHGSDLNFFWSTNWIGNPGGVGTFPNTASNVVFYTSNFHVTNPDGPAMATDDPIWYYDGTNWGIYSGNLVSLPGNTIFNNDGPGGVSQFILTARIIVPYKNRLVMLSTIENNGVSPFTASTNSSFPQRARFSAFNQPFTDNPAPGVTEVGAWVERGQLIVAPSGGNWVSGGAGFIDAATEEDIVSAEFIKDQLIVYFERSTWALVYTGNQVEPFSWQKINTELGSEATFSTVPFDKVILTVGNTGIHACNAANTERIDSAIPEKVFEIKDKITGVPRIAGIRDYYNEMVYWTFPSDNEQQNETFPNRILVYNYQNGSWAFNDDCITTWGYFQQQTDSTWATIEGPWQQANYEWDSGIIQAQFRQIIAGNQQGFVFILNADRPRNEGVMQLTNMTQSGVSVILTIVDHTLQTGDYILIENATTLAGSATQYNNKIVQVKYRTTDTVTISAISTTNPNYTGGGTVTRVSQIDIWSKQWNPYVDKDRNVAFQRIDFGVLRTPNGAITVDYFPSSTEVSMLDGGEGTGCLMGTGVLETSAYPTVTLEESQTRLWHPVYFQTDGECIQIRIYLSDAQMVVNNIALSNFELEGMVLFTTPTTTRLG